MGGEVSVPTDRSRTIQVIGAGFSRTGTVSTSMALAKLLDGPVLHGGTQILGREDSYPKLWTRIYEARHAGDKPKVLKLLREATAGFVGITDLPGNDFISELQELYPDAEVIVVTRDPERWWKSVEMIMNTTTPSWLGFLLLPCPTWRWFPGLISWFTVSATELHGYQSSGPHLLNQHTEWVRSVTRPEKFHVVELKDGWAPLCKILNKPVPDAPFPRANDADAVDVLAKHIMSRAALAWLGIVSSAGAAAYGAWWLWQGVGA